MAWLYLPGVEDSNSDSPLHSELITEQSPTWKGKSRPLRSWQRTWNDPNQGWIRHLSGMTLEPSQAMSLAHSMDALPQVTSRWLTPSANEDAAGTLEGNMQNMLSHQAQQQAQSGEIFSPDAPTLPLRLNPLFVEWMMGWPEGWLEMTGCVSSGTE